MKSKKEIILIMTLGLMQERSCMSVPSHSAFELPVVMQMLRAKCREGVELVQALFFEKKIKERSSSSFNFEKAHPKSTHDIVQSLPLSVKGKKATEGAFNLFSQYLYYRYGKKAEKQPSFSFSSYSKEALNEPLFNF